MANTVTTQTLHDGPRNLVILLTGLLDTSDEARAIKVDVSSYDPAPTRVRVDRMQYSTSDNLVLILDWDATTDIRFAAVTGAGEVDACKIGGLVNNAGAGNTGDIYLTTVGWGSGVKAYTLLLEMTKVSF
jgi:hypothetical protein